MLRRLCIIHDDKRPRLPVSWAQRQPCSSARAHWQQRAVLRLPLVFHGSQPDLRIGSGCFKNPAGQLGAGSGGFQICRVESGRPDPGSTGEKWPTTRPVESPGCCNRCVPRCGPTPSPPLHPVLDPSTPSIILQPFFCALPRSTL